MWIPLHKLPHFAYRKHNNSNSSSMPFQLYNNPKTERINNENVFLSGMEIGHSSMQGYRMSMEDEHIIDTMLSLKDHVLVAVMDGHAGVVAAKCTAQCLREVIEDTEQWKTYAAMDAADRRDANNLLCEALVQSFIDMDDVLRNLDEMDHSGCTAVCSIITPSHIVCASVGDSRCVIGSNGKTIALTEDHKPNNPAERKRIESAGGFVLMDRVNGELAMSRAIGDFRYKQDLTLANSQYPVICYPDVAVYERSPGMDEIMILACDGVWDVISNTEAVSYCNDIVLAGAAVSNVDTQSEETESSEESTELPKQPLKKRRLDIPNINGKAGRIDRSSSADELDLLDASKQSDITAEEVASSLIELALAEGSTDNITALVVKFLDNNTLVSNADLRI